MISQAYRQLILLSLLAATALKPVSAVPPGGSRQTPPPVVELDRQDIHAPDEPFTMSKAMTRTSLKVPPGFEGKTTGATSSSAGAEKGKQEAEDWWKQWKAQNQDRLRPSRQASVEAKPPKGSSEDGKAKATVETDKVTVEDPTPPPAASKKKQKPSPAARRRAAAKAAVQATSVKPSSPPAEAKPEVSSSSSSRASSGGESPQRHSDSDSASKKGSEERGEKTRSPTHEPHRHSIATSSTDHGEPHLVKDGKGYELYHGTRLPENLDLDYHERSPRDRTVLHREGESHLVRRPLSPEIERLRRPPGFDRAVGSPMIPRTQPGLPFMAPTEPHPAHMEHELPPLRTRPPFFLPVHALPPAIPLAHPLGAVGFFPAPNPRAHLHAQLLAQQLHEVPHWPHLPGGGAPAFPNHLHF